MYEVVRIVKGYEIYRMKGTKGCYHVTIKKFANGNEKFCTFKTIKAATEFIENSL